MAENVVHGKDNRKVQAFSEAVNFIKHDAHKQAVKVALDYNELPKRIAAKQDKAQMKLKVKMKLPRFNKEHVSDNKKRRKEIKEEMEKEKKKMEGKEHIKRKLKVRDNLSKIVKTSLTERRMMERRRENTIIVLSHIPVGFTSESLAEYFEQFGEVNKATLCRSEKTGRSKGYALIDFKDPDVAKIAADTMNNYVMRKRLLKAMVAPRKLWVKRMLVENISDKKYPGLMRREKHVKIVNMTRKMTRQSRIEKRMEKVENIMENLHARGLPYIYKPEKDRLMKYIEDQLDEMKIMKREEVSTEDLKNKVPSNDRKKLVSSKDQNMLVASKDRKNLVASNNLKNKVPSNDQKKLVSSKDRKLLVASKDGKMLVASKDGKMIVASKKRKNLVASNNRKKQVPSKDRKKKVLTEDQKKVIPLCSGSDIPVLEVDESDEEIEFKTPPNVIKRRLSVLKSSGLSAKQQEFVVNDGTENKTQILKPTVESISKAVKKTLKTKATGEKRLKHKNDSTSSTVKKSLKRKVIGVQRSGKVDKLNKPKLQRKENNDGKSRKLFKK